MHDEIRPVAPRPVDDSEGQMAKSELYRAAKYSMKLFQMIDEHQDLEGWVQAKITKSADYLDSVYHYMEYQVKFGGGDTASSIDDITGDAGDELVKTSTISDMDDEEELDKKVDESMKTYEEKLEALLEGAMKKAVKGKKAEDKKEELDEEKIKASGVRAGDKKKGKVEKSERKIYFVKLEKDNKVKGVTTQAEEGESQGEVRDRVKRENMGWTVASIREKNAIDEAAEMIAKAGKAAKAAKAKKEKEAMVKEAITTVVEKAVSKAQQKFMGMVHAAKKGEKPASKEVAKAAKGMSKKDAKDFASTKHKGLPEKKEKDVKETFMPSKDPGKKYPTVGGPVGKGIQKAGELAGKGIQKAVDKIKGKPDEEMKEAHKMFPPQNPDGATAPPPKDPKTGKYPKITSGPNKGKEWSQEKPGPTNPDFKEDRDLVKNIVRKVVAEKKKGDGNLANNAKPYDKVTKGDVVAGRLGKDEMGGKKDEKKETVKESAELVRMKQFLTRLNG